MHFETHVMGDIERRLRWAIGLGVVAAVLLVMLTSANTQPRPRDDIRTIRPREMAVEFERLLVKEIEEERSTRVVLDYTVDRESWRELQRRELQLWLELRVPWLVQWRFRPYNYFMTVVPLDERDGRVSLSDWVRVDTADLVGLCPVVVSPETSPMEGRGYFCQALEWLRVRSDWSVEIATGQRFRLRYQQEAYPVIYWYWIEPYWVVPLPTPGGR